MAKQGHKKTEHGKSKGAKDHKSHASRPHRPSIIELILFFWIVMILAALVWSVLPFRKSSRSSSHGTTQAGSTQSIPSYLQPDDQVYPQYAGSESCRECHPSEYDLWLPSNHRLAERNIDPAIDREAFDPPHSIRHASQISEARIQNGQYQLVTLGFGNRREAYPLERVIGNDPLRQFLVPRPKGKYQVTELAWDPHAKEWFDVYGDEDRKPGEWGHWTGRGMNWNSMCACCHNTRLRKKYHEADDSYSTVYAEMGVGCEACHGPSRDHVLWQRKHPNAPEGSDPTLKALHLTTNQWVHTCGSCHVRRGDLTGDFVPGDSFFDHYILITVDASDIYYPDGQVHEEDYEFAAFLGSKMYNAGVSCLDCHDPHRAKPLYEGTDQCMRCHNGSYTNAPIIDPDAHAFHEPNTPGYDCKDCHMPITVYMARHRRHDHGFTIPDPLLTIQFGIPNACNRCHTNETAQWSLEWVNKWYGKEKMQRRTRERAQWIARARQGDTNSIPHLLRLLKEESYPYWRAALVTMLSPWIDQPQVKEAVLAATKDPHPLVREKAWYALEPLVGEIRDPVVRSNAWQALHDPIRCVRVAAAWALKAELDLESQAAKELLHMLQYSADQPAGLLHRATFLVHRGKLKEAIQDLETAVRWDPFSAPLRHELAVLYDMAGRPQDALKQMEEACRLAPQNVEFRYRLALVWAEVGNIQKTVEILRQVVQLDPHHPRAWYNLGLALNQLGDAEGALDALERAETENPQDPRIPYARATILVQLGRMMEARTATRRALEIAPDFAPAKQLLETLP